MHLKILLSIIRRKFYSFNIFKKKLTDWSAVLKKQPYKKRTPQHTANLKHKNRCINTPKTIYNVYLLFWLLQHFSLLSTAFRPKAAKTNVFKKYLFWTNILRSKKDPFWKLHCFSKRDKQAFLCCLHTSPLF